jgi:hypothetical protein
MSLLREYHVDVSGQDIVMLTSKQSDSNNDDMIDLFICRGRYSWV